ncbi:MAG TPA: extracellular solute-binding protein, partial [Gemmata sp.]|nr:extracellular solute-binding protein [Gemmata sp.]
MPAAKPAPYSGVSLKIRCPDRAFVSAIAQPSQSWASRTGANVSLVTESMTAGDDSDIGIISIRELGLWADKNELVPVPASLRATDHPFKWTGVLPAYREQLIEWGGQARALPLAGEGLVIVYRADRLAEPSIVSAFEKRTGNKPRAPSTWEEFADLAGTFAEVDGHPSLTAMTGPEIANLFF